MKGRNSTKIVSVPLIVALGVFHAGCGQADNSVWWQQEQERLELSHRLELVTFRHDQVHSTDLEELSQLKDQADSNFAHLAMLKGQRAELTSELGDMERERSGFLGSILEHQRRLMVGKSFDRFTTSSGRSFESASVSAIDDAGVTIRHSAGSARLRFEDLDSQQRIMFGLEEELALEAKRVETREALAYDQWIDGKMSSIREKEERLSQTASREAKSAQLQRAAAASRLLASASVRPLARPATSFGNGSSSSRYYSSYRTPRSYYRYVYYQPSYSPSQRCNNSQIYTYPRRAERPNCTGAPVVTPRRSFAETTIPSIP